MAAIPNSVKHLVEFDAATHSYYVDGELVISTTQVFRDAAMIDTQWFREWHRWRGSETHKAVATFNRAGKIDLRTVDPKIKPYLQAALKWKKDTNFVTVLFEHRMYDPIFNVCSTLDEAGYFGVDHQPSPIKVIVDYKTNDWKQGQLCSKWQLASYGHALDPTQIYERMEVILGPDGNYGPVNSFSADTYLQHVNEFHALSITAKLRREGGLIQ